MSLVGFINSRWGPTAGISLARILPRGLAERLAEGLARRIASQEDSELVQTIRANQAVARGLPSDDSALQQVVEQVILATARTYLSLFLVMRKGRAALQASASMDPRIIDTALQLLQQGRGVIFAGAHTVGFDHLLLLLGGLNYPVQVLSYAQPKGSYSTQNRIRLSFGLNLTPINYESLRTAIGHLRHGGIVVTAVDRPEPAGEMLDFFGHPARLPVGHARLAWRTGAPVLLGACQTEGSDRHRAVYLGSLEADRTQEEMVAARALAQQSIRVLENFIRRRPQEWLMFHPVWGEG